MNETLNAGFAKKYTEILKDDAELFLKSLDRKPVRHIRLSEHRDIDYTKEFDYLGIKYEKLKEFKGMYRITEGAEKLTDTITFLTGGGYIMNPSSAFPAEILSSLVPEESAVLDVSAAPGGKTVALCDLLGNGSLVIANEPSNKRLKSLNYNLEKHGCYSAKTVSFDGRVLDKFFEEKFDGILLDAPCSNENKIARNRTVNSEWDQDLVERMAKLQKEILASAYACLRPGGVLVYSTCTFSPEENEGVIQYAVDELPECEVININEDRYGGGISGNSEIDQSVIRVMPHVLPYDGFFIAGIRKAGSTKPNYKKNKYKAGVLEKFFNDVPKNISVCSGKDRSFIESALHPEVKAKFNKSGINAYRRDSEISSQLLWEWGAKAKNEHIVKADYEDCIQYMKGFDISISNDYYGVFLFWENIPVGTVKPVNNMLKNKLDRYFLYGRDIRW